MAGGPGGRSVGSVSVRVAPDTSGFGQDLKAYLERLENTLRATLTVDIDLDDSALQAKLARLRGESVHIDTEVETPVVPQVRADSIHVPTDVEKPVVPPVKVPPVKVPVDVDVDGGSKAKLRAEVAAMAKAAKATVHVDVDIDKQGGFSRIGSILSTVGSSIAGATGLFGTLGSTASKAGGSIAEVGSAFTNMGAAGTGALGKVGPPMLAVASIATELAGAGIGAVTSLAKFAAIAGTVTFAVGAIGVAMGALPGLITAGAAAFAIFKLGADGAKNAVKVIQPELDALKKSISGIVQSGLESTFRSLASTISGPLKRGLEEVTRAGLSLIDTLAGVFRTPAGGALLEQSLNNVANLVRRITPGVTELAGAFLRVAANGSIMNSLGGIIDDLFAKTARWFDLMNNSGRFSQGMDVLRQVLSSVEDLLFSVLTKASDFFISAGPGVAAFFDGIKSAIDNIDFASLGESFGQVAEAIGNVIAAVPPGAWQQLTDGISDLAEAISNFLNSPQGALALEAVIRGIGLAFSLAGTFIQKFSGFIQGVTSATEGVISFFQNFGPTVSAAFETAKTSIGDFFTSLGTTIGGAFESAYTTVSGWVTTIVTWIQTKWNEAVTWVDTSLSNMWTSVSNWFSQQYDAVVNWLSQIGTWISTKWNEATTYVSTALSGMWNTVTTWFTNIYNTVSQYMAQVVSWISTKWNEAVAFVSSALNNIWTTVTTIWNNITTAVQTALTTIGNAVRTGWEAVKSAVSTAMEAVRSAVTAAWNAVRTAVSTAINTIVSAVRTGWNNVTTAIRTAMDNALNAVRTTFNNVVNAVRTGIQNAVNAVRSFVGAFVSAGRAIIDGIIRGVQSGVGALVGAVQAAASRALAAAKSFLGIASPSRVFRDVVGVMIPRGVAVGVDRGTAFVTDAVKKLAATAVDQAQNVAARMGDGVQVDLLGSAVRDSIRALGRDSALLNQARAVGAALGDATAGAMSAAIGVTGDWAMPGSVYGDSPALRARWTDVGTSPGATPTTAFAPSITDLAEALTSAITGQSLAIDTRGGELVARYVNKTNVQNGRR